MNHHKKVQLDILEDDIDHGGLTDLLSTLADICLAKWCDSEQPDKDRAENWMEAHDVINAIIPTIKELVG